MDWGLFCIVSYLDCLRVSHGEERADQKSEALDLMVYPSSNSDLWPSSMVNG